MQLMAASTPISLKRCGSEASTSFSLTPWVEPNTAFLPDAMRTASGHMTSTDPRIIAAGAVRTDYGGMAAQAMAEGISAAIAAHRLLAKS